MNLFNTIHNWVNSQNQTLYGDLLEHTDKSEIYQRNIRNICSADEYDEYKKIAEQDRRRLIGIKETQQHHNNINNKPKNVYIFGVGEAQQIC